MPAYYNEIDPKAAAKGQEDAYGDLPKPGPRNDGYGAGGSGLDDEIPFAPEWR